MVNVLLGVNVPRGRPWAASLRAGGEVARGPLERRLLLVEGQQRREHRDAAEEKGRAEEYNPKFRHGWAMRRHFPPDQVAT